MENILLIRLKSIGDVLLTLPAVHVVRENHPAARITFLTSMENSALLRGFREVDEVIALDRANLRSGNPMIMGAELFRLLQKLRAGRFSLVVDFQSYGETAWLTRLTGAPRRWGIVHRACQGWAYTAQLPNVPLHAAAANLELLRHGGMSLGNIRNQFHLPPDELAAAGSFFRDHLLETGEPTLFIQPFTSGAHKNWPLENYLAVARHWRDRGIQIIFGGGPADRAALQPAVAEDFCVAAGVPLLVTGGLMQLSTLVLGGDTGALHLAVAQGKRVLMLMHLADLGSPIPFQHPEWVIAAPEPAAIAKITVAEVNAAIAGSFNAPAGSVAC